jgi:hypothetical protein
MRLVACMGEKTGAYRIFVGKLKEDGTLRRQRCRWDYDNDNDDNSDDGN